MVAAKESVKPATPARGSPGKSSTEASTAGAGKTAGRSARTATATKTPDKPIDPLAGLTLDATCIVGGQRLAMISGRLYAAKETLSAGKSSTPAYKVVDVLPYKVLLENDGKTVELTYSDVARPAASKPANSRAKPAGAAGASRAKSGGTSRSSMTKKK